MDQSVNWDHRKKLRSIAMKKRPVNRKGLVFIAHGSHNKSANAEIEKLVEILKEKNKNKYACINHAFLQFARPSIEDVINLQIKLGMNEIILFPYFLSSGNHVVNDIPLLVNAYQKKFPEKTFTILPIFGASSHIAILINRLI